MSLPVQNISESGLEATYYDAASYGTNDAVTLAWDQESEDTALEYYDDFPNSGHTVLAVKNESSGDRMATVLAQQGRFQDRTYGGSEKKDISYTVAAGEMALIGPFRSRAYNDGNMAVQVVYDQIDSLKVAALKINNVNPVEE